MNITDANAANVVLRYLLGAPNINGDLPADDQAREAAELLADKANKALGAGLTKENVTALWPGVTVCPRRDQ